MTIFCGTTSGRRLRLGEDQLCPENERIILDIVTFVAQTQTIARSSFVECDYLETNRGIVCEEFNRRKAQREKFAQIVLVTCQNEVANVINLNHNRRESERK